MKAKITFLTLLFCFFPVLKSQINMTDSTVQTVAYWNLNESYVYEVIQSSFSKEGDKEAKSDSISMKAKVTVIDSTETSYTIMWEFSDYNVRESAFSPKLETLLKAQKVIYRTDELGSFQELLNWEEVRDNLIARTKESIALLSSQYESEEFKENIDKAMNTTLQTISSKEYITNKEIEQVLLFHTFMGGLYKLGEIIKSEIEMPNNYFPEKPFKSRVTLVLDKIVEEDNFSVIRYEQAVDTEQLTATVKDYIGQIAKSMGQEINLDEAIAGQQLEHNSSVAAAIDNWGWPLYIESITKVNLGGTEKTTTISIELIE